MGQLQGDLDEGIWTGAALLNQTFSKVIEGENVRVHIISQSPGDCQRALDDLLALKKITK